MAVVAVVAVAIAGLFTGARPALVPRPPPPPKLARPGAPNIVFLLTDDQDHYHLNDTSLTAMPKARDLLAASAV